MPADCRQQLQIRVGRTAVSRYIGRGTGFPCHAVHGGDGTVVAADKQIELLPQRKTEQLERLIVSWTHHTQKPGCGLT
jgi:hypothetical protein